MRKIYTLILSTVVLHLSLNAQIQYSLITTNPTCPGGQDGSITINPTNCGTDFTYTWLPNLGTSNVVGNLGAGTYTVTITPQGGGGGGTPQTLFTSDFEDMSQWNLISGGTGVNYWGINNIYQGGNILLFLVIPNVPAQPATFSNPGGNYLHPMSQVGLDFGVLNANYYLAGLDIYDAVMTSPVNTSALSDVTVSFYRTGGLGGLSMIYSIDNGATWQTAQTFTDNPTTWVQETVSIPEFNNQTNLKIGFRLDDMLSTDPAGNHFHSIDEVKITSGGAFVCDPVTVEIVLENPGGVGSPQINTPNGNTAFCQGGSLQLSADNGLSNIVWSNGSTGSTINVNTGGNYSYTATNADGCDLTSETISVSVESPIAADFTLSVNGQVVTFTSNTIAQTYLWDFGDGNSASGQVALHSYANAGNYTVVHTVGNSCGSFDSEKTVIINASGIENTQLVSFKMYPNPTQDNVWIEFFKTENTEKQIQFIDIAGKVLQTFNTFNSENFFLNVANYPDGIYFVRVSTPNFINISKLVVKH